MPQLELAVLKALPGNGPAKDWRRTVGRFTDNPGMKELFAEAMKLREADRRKARRRPRISPSKEENRRMRTTPCRPARTTGPVELHSGDCMSREERLRQPTTT